MTRRKPILITLLFAVTAVVFSVALVADMDANTKVIPIKLDDSVDVLQVSMIIEDKDYVRDGLLPPDDQILNVGDVLDLEDGIGKKSQYYEGLENLFVGYDSIVIIEERWPPHKEEANEKATYIFLTKEPFEYETLTGQFYYDMIGIKIWIFPKGDDINKDSYQNEGKSDDQIFVTIPGKDGDLVGVGEEKFRAQMIDGTWFNLPTHLAFIDNEHSVIIRGFLTMDQAVELAKVIRR